MAVGRAMTGLDGWNNAWLVSQLILWSHALAALLFGALVLGAMRRPRSGGARRAFVAALALTALWALATAGIDPRDLSVRIVYSVRDVAWLVFLYALARQNRIGGIGLASVYAAIMGIAAACAGIALVETLPLPGEVLAALASARLALRMLGAVGALLLVHDLRTGAKTGATGGVSLILGAVSLMWATDAVVAGVGLASGDAAGVLLVGRGAAMVAVGLLLALATQKNEAWTLALSRSVALRSASIAAIGLYVAVVVLMTAAAGRWGGPHARLVETAIVFGAAATLLTLVSTPWLRAWAKVMVAKHFFSHRYDYRAEWQRFTATLGTSGADAPPLDRRVVQAVANLTDSPAALLLVATDGVLETGLGWNWDHERARPDEGGDASFAADLAATRHIVELDAVRSGRDTVDVPAWIVAMADAWAIVPLLHGEALVGAILLARPPVDRALDWEDFDLLRVAGRQAASYLAEDRAHAALADAARFDEFNRRFAFMLHDIKNLVSQLSLVARNAERHADNPDFRADMVATLQDCSGRMNALLARLSQHHAARPEPIQPVDPAALLLRVASRLRSQHPITCRMDAAMPVEACPAQLEQVVVHLVQNAIEASAPSDAVTLSAFAEGDRVIMEIADQGCGMSAAFVRDQLFRPFVSSKPGGFGIGAFEARQLVVGMGGAVSVVSREGEGTRFRIALPRATIVGQEIAA